MSEIFTQFSKNPASVLINFIVLYASHSNKTDDYINSLNTTGLKNLVRSRRSLSNVHIYTFAVKRYVLCVSLTIVKQNGILLGGSVSSYQELANRMMSSIEEFQEAFQLFDSRGDGKIHVAQIGDALRALGQNPTESDVKKFTHQHKPDERISFEVFLPIYQAISKARTSDTADDFIEGLRHFDKDGNGFISSAELRHLLTTLGEKLSDEEVETLLAGHEDSQGNINYEDFVRQVMCG
ncbi:myosin-2 essential light chain isoform X1 [Bombus vosnesenskii]|uniref:Myosin-2 essential light chain isoform X1 n=3 Tax=Bombus TaxID=28641 RepID=A0A6J3KAX8_9HYME|nr:myosin-2 essential light chain isoform X1 [Bombus vancouverensis nearcticus]XP_033319090.1 myosin-2 essential light chain isoform X1 [Bombus bifarius]XP_033349865.1 myosin-2 essential light chain isoform X1 [Bombus vosnesenskii]